MAVKNPPWAQARISYPLDDIEAERQHRKEMLAGGMRILAKLGIDQGVSSMVMARDPELPDHYWVNPFDVSFNQIRVSDLLLCHQSGTIVQGPEQKIINVPAFAIQAKIMQHRTDAIACIHTHSLYIDAWSATGQFIPPVNPTACAFYQEHALFDEYTGIKPSEEVQQDIVHSLGDKKAIILQNHGLICVDECVEAAYWWMIAADRCCQVHMLSTSTGYDVEVIKKEEAIKTRDEASGHPFAGWLAFRPYWQDILKDDPSFLA